MYQKYRIRGACTLKQTGIYAAVTRDTKHLRHGNEESDKIFYHYNFNICVLKIIKRSCLFSNTDHESLKFMDTLPENNMHGQIMHFKRI